MRKIAASSLLTLGLCFMVIVCSPVECISESTTDGTSNSETLNLPKTLTGKIKTDYFTLYYDPKFKEDAEKEKHYLEQTIEALKKEFSAIPVDKMLKVQCDVILHSQKTDQINESSANTESGSQGDNPYSARIDLLTPSQYDPNYRNNVGISFSDDAAFKLVAHEYSTILFERITREKKKGIRFQKCPRWFVQGYEEYCGLVLTSPFNRSKLTNKYISFFRTDPDRINFDFGIEVTNPYIDGAMLVLFMNESYGKDNVQKILTSSESNFGKVLTSSLGGNLSQFKERWQKWLQTRLSLKE